MSMLAWDRLLETCVNRGATDIILIPGMPPFLRVENGLQSLRVDALSAVELAQMLLKLRPPDELGAEGYLNFDVPYGEHWCRVASFGFPSPQVTMVMRLPRSAASGESAAI